MREKRVKRAAHGLQFNVAQLLKEATGATRIYDINTKAISKLDENALIISPLVGQVKFLRTGPDILVIGSITGTIQKTCGRCLTTFRAPVSIELEEEFYPTLSITTGNLLSLPPDADEANRIDKHHILDLLEVVRQRFFLESDSLLYCRPDCRGLCPQCGQDRNTEPCTCEDNPVDLRWADLQALRLED